MQDSLLSRFDLIFIVLDEVSELSEHIRSTWRHLCTIIGFDVIFKFINFSNVTFLDLIVIVYSLNRWTLRETSVFQIMCFACIAIETLENKMEKVPHQHTK